MSISSRYRFWMMVCLSAGQAVLLSDGAMAAEPQPYAQPPLMQPVVPAWGEKTIARDGMTIHVGPIRKLMMAARTPLLTAFNDGTIVLIGGSKVGSQTLRSKDHGFSWRLQKNTISEGTTLELRDGLMIELGYNITPVAGRKGQYEFNRWVSKDEGLTVTPTTKAKLSLPDDFDPKLPKWFSGSILQMPSGEILAPFQGQEVGGNAHHAWGTYLIASKDQGKTWRYVSRILSKETIDDPDNMLGRNGWKLYYAVEASLIHLDGDHLVCVARAADDEFSNMPASLIPPASDTFHDLNYTVQGDGIYPGLMKLPADKYYVPGRRNVPIVIAYSSDGGKHWSRGKPMKQARGVYPRLAYDGKVLALSYGGLSGVPRWGNCISFSADGGETWTDEINFGPFLTTGYTGLIATGPGRFTVFFDCTPPQPWTNDHAFWIGAVDIHIEKTSTASH